MIMNQKEIERGPLRRLWTDCVNKVGVDLNTAFRASFGLQSPAYPRRSQRTFVAYREGKRQVHQPQAAPESGQIRPQGLRAMCRIHADPGRGQSSGWNQRASRSPMRQPKGCLRSRGYKAGRYKMGDKHHQRLISYQSRELQIPCRRIGNRRDYLDGIS